MPVFTYTADNILAFSKDSAELTIAKLAAVELTKRHQEEFEQLKEAIKNRPKDFSFELIDNEEQESCFPTP